MPSAHPAALVAVHSRGAAYDLVLLAHVLAGLVALGAVAAAGLSALALRRWGPTSEPVRRYYRPGVNWAGRILFGVPVLGVVLMAMSHGDWTFADGWITAGLILWAVVAVVAEMVLWPAERRLQAVVGDDAVGDDAVGDDAEGDDAVGDERMGDDLTPAPLLRSQCLRVAWTASALAVALVAASLVMVTK